MSEPLRAQLGATSCTPTPSVAAGCRLQTGLGTRGCGRVRSRHACQEPRLEPRWALVPYLIPALAASPALALCPNLTGCSLPAPLSPHESLLAPHTPHGSLPVIRHRVAHVGEVQHCPGVPAAATPIRGAATSHGCSPWSAGCPVWTGGCSLVWWVLTLMYWVLSLEWWVLTGVVGAHTDVVGAHWCGGCHRRTRPELGME